MRADLTVIAVNYESGGSLAACFRSIRDNAGGLLLQFVIVDNGSSDGSLEAALAVAPDAIVVGDGTNVGFGAGINVALSSDAAATFARWILVANPDTELVDGDLGTVVLAMNAHPEFAVAGPRIVDPSGDLDFSQRRFPTLGRELVAALGLHHLRRFADAESVVRDRRRYRRACSADWVSGCVLLFRSDALASVGPFDERFFLYSEETDWCRRAHNAGWDVGYLPQVTFRHSRGARKDSPELFATYVESQRRYDLKHRGAAFAMVHRLVLSLWLLARLAAPRAGGRGARARVARVARAGLRQAWVGGRDVARTRRVVISWIDHHARSVAIARLLKADAHFMPWAHPHQALPMTVRGWLRSSRETIRLLLALPRGSLAVVMAPPVFAPLVAWPVTRLRGVRLVIDVHSGAFNKPEWRWSRGLMRALMRASHAALVTNSELLAGVGNSGRVYVLHDPLRDMDESAPATTTARPYVVFPASGQWDEPVAAVASAADLLAGHVDVVVTGRPAAGLDASAAKVTGFLPEAAYEDIMRGAAAVLALTTREATMQQAAYEALEFGVPIVCSDTRVLVDTLGDSAIAVEATGPSLARGIRDAIVHREQLHNAGRAVAAQMRDDCDVVAALLTADAS